MNETLKRAISGVVYITLLIASILYSNETFFILFGIFLLIAVYEYCALVHLKKIISIIFAFLLYGGVTLICFYKKEDIKMERRSDQKSVPYLSLLSRDAEISAILISQRVLPIFL